MGLVDAMLEGWRDPRGAMARQVALGLSEARALLHLMIACGLYFVASLPNAVRGAQGLAIENPIEGAISAHVFGYLALAPLIAYALAAIVHVVARAFGARGGFVAARSALFWAALLGAPLALVVAMAGVATEGASWAPGLILALSYVALGFWFWLFAASLAEAEGFSRTGWVAATVVVAFGGIAGVLGFLAGRGGV